MQVLREREIEKTTIKVDPRDMSAMRQAEKLAKDTDSDIDLRKEQQAAQNADMTVIAHSIKGVLEQATRDSGMDVSVAEVQNISGSGFSITVQHPNEHTETYKFTLDERGVLTVQSDSYLPEKIVDLGQIGTSPSGEVFINTEVAKGNLIDYLSITPLSTLPTQAKPNQIFEKIRKTKKLREGISIQPTHTQKLNSAVKLLKTLKKL